MKYFDIHVTYDNAKDGAGYSIFVKANTSNEDIVCQNVEKSMFNPQPVSFMPRLNVDISSGKA